MVEHPTNWSNFETGICLDVRDLSLVDMLHSDSLKDFACLTWALSLYLLPMSLESAVWFGQIPNLWQDSQPPPLGTVVPFPGHVAWMDTRGGKCPRSCSSKRGSGHTKGAQLRASSDGRKQQHPATMPPSRWSSNCLRPKSLICPTQSPSSLRQNLRDFPFFCGSETWIYFEYDD